MHSFSPSADPGYNYDPDYLYDEDMGNANDAENDSLHNYISSDSISINLVPLAAAPALQFDTPDVVIEGNTIRLTPTTALQQQHQHIFP